MAEYVERKYTAAKLSVALAIAAMLGGVAARDSSAGAATPAKGAEPHLGEGSITTAQIKNESLLFEDFKPGEIYSKGQANDKFLKQREANQKWLKIKDANNTFIKEVDANNTFIKEVDANNTFIKGEDANKTFVKIEDAQHQFVNGDGKVMTGFEASTGATVPVLNVPGMVLAEGIPAAGAPTQVRLTNQGTTPLHFAAGGGGGAGVIAPGKTQAILISGNNGGSSTVQLIQEGSPPVIGTLTVSAILNGQTTNFSGQILIGMEQ